MVRVRRVRLHNPRRKSSLRRRAKRRNRNPLGGGELIVMTNPKRRSRRRRSNKSYRSHSRRRRSRNPKLHFGSRSRRHRNSFFKRSRRRRNPGVMAAVRGLDLVEIAKVGAGAAVGGLAARSLTQMVLQANNTGYVGYAGNLVASLLLGWAGNKFLGRNVGLGIAAGGFSATILRIWQEQVSQTSPSSMSGLGDLDFSTSGLGEYAGSLFPLPTVSSPVTTAGGQHLLTPAPVAAAVAAGKGVHGLGKVNTGRYPSRYN
jgi:hypothetical protein